jgi:hypothetical protein
MNAMLSDRFLYCRDCNEVHHVTPFDTAPIYVLEDRSVRQIPVDDLQSFRDRHFGHKLEELTSVPETDVRLGQLVDPMKTGYVEVTNGRDFFVLRSFRRDIADPLSYELLPRQLVFWEIAHDHQESEGTKAYASSSQTVPASRYCGSKKTK